jgi:hypothetical protein
MIAVSVRGEKSQMVSQIVFHKAGGREGQSNSISRIFEMRISSSSAAY